MIKVYGGLSAGGMLAIGWGNRLVEGGIPGGVELMGAGGICLVLVPAIWVVRQLRRPA